MAPSNQVSLSKPSTSFCKGDEELTFGKALAELRQQQWYWGNISTKKTEQLLKNRPAGTFLVRDSRSEHYFFSFSYQTAAGVFHSHIVLHNGIYCLGGPNSLIQSTSLVELVKKAIKSSEEKSCYHILMHPDPSNANQRYSDVHIQFPLNRCDLLPPLKHLCRITIRHSIRSDNDLNRLPLPRNLQKYLAVSAYLSPV
ncbi:Mediator complex subunit 23 [Aphelenchoides bicaudatus]|nr:Mediator complex subunit 23 [Aphelenchoides bicaudatus]